MLNISISHEAFFFFFLLHAKELIRLIKQEAAKLRINSLRGQLI
jgi:hypothetical protein